MYSFDLSDKLKFKLHKLAKKDRKRFEIVNRKIREIVAIDPALIDHYKNLRHDMSDRKRVHIDGPFIMTFRVDKARDFIFFLDYDHHDNIYGR